MITYGSPDNPFFENFDHIVEFKGGGTVVIVELPESFAYLRSNDPPNDIWTEGFGFYLPDVEIPKEDFKEFWSFEAYHPEDGRYYTSTSFLYAPIGYIEDFPPYEILTAGPFPDTTGLTAPFGDSAFVAIGAEGPGSAAEVMDFYGALSDYEQALFDFFSYPDGSAPAAIFRYGVELAGGFGVIPNTFGLTDGGGVADWNYLIKVNSHDDVLTWCALVNMRKHRVDGAAVDTTKEVEVFQSTGYFQEGHDPTPAVKLSAFKGGKFKVDPATKRLINYKIDPDTGLPVPGVPKWTKTILLPAYPPLRDEDVSLGRFNAKGFADPGHPLPE